LYNLVNYLISFHGWEVGLERGGSISILLPSGSDGLPLRVEIDGTLTVEVSGSPHRFLISSKAEHWKWYWNSKVNSNLTGFDLMLELSGGGSGFSHNRNTISKLVCVDQIDGFL